MRDASVLLLMMVLAHMAIDSLSSTWRTKGRAPAGAWLSSITVVVYALMMGGMMYLSGQSAAFSVGAGMLIGVFWAFSRWLLGKWTWKFVFLVRFLLNLAVLAAVWLSAESDWNGMWLWAKSLASSHNLLLLLGYVLVLRPSSIVIGTVLSPWLASVNTQGSLKSAGTLIGYLERALILTFVLQDQWEAIGFLLTAKSILRFSDIKGFGQRALSEYVLLGTLLSFSISIGVGLAVTRLSGQ